MVPSSVQHAHEQGDSWKCFTPKSACIRILVMSAGKKDSPVIKQIQQSSFCSVETIPVSHPVPA